jgi:hypothetical protein
MIGLAGYSRLNYGQPVNRAQPLNCGLVGWWLVLPQWRGGLAWRDLVKRHNATLTALATADAWQGPCGRPGGWGSLDFDGTDGTAVVSYHPRIAVAVGNFTVSCWIRPEAANWGTGQYRTIFDSEDRHLSMFLDAGAANGYFYGVGQFGDGGTFSETWVVNEWQHFAWTRLGIACVLYRNGRQVAQFDGNAYVTNARDWHIGGNPSGSGVFWDGKQDDVRLYNRWLSGAEVRELYSRSLRGQDGLLSRTRRPVYFAPAAPPGGFVPYPRPRGARAGMTALTGGTH